MCRSGSDVNECHERTQLLCRKGEKRWKGSTGGLRQRRTSQGTSELVSYGGRDSKRSHSEPLLSFFHFSIK